MGQKFFDFFGQKRLYLLFLKKKFESVELTLPTHDMNFTFINFQIKF